MMSAMHATLSLDDVPRGAWAVGVSGGADSVALLLLLHELPGVSLRVVHLDHELRGPESAADAAFVADLRRKSACRATSRRGPPSNRPSRIAAQPLGPVPGGAVGVVPAGRGGTRAPGRRPRPPRRRLAETVLARLLRGSGPAGLAGISRVSAVGGLTILRPLLNARRAALRAMLRLRGQASREDASNGSEDYQRNRLRKLLARREELVGPLLNVARSCRAVKDWTLAAAPRLPAEFPAAALASLPPVLARETARRWLTTAARRPATCRPPCWAG